MPKYTCERCLKEFSQKSHYDKHQNKKKPCQDNKGKIEEVVEKLINEGVIVGQGKKVDGVAQPQQAYWFSRSDFKKHNKLFSDYFVMITDESELIQYLNEN